jgi:hypothetical protein
MKLNKCNIVHVGNVPRFMWKPPWVHVGTATLGCPIERSSMLFVSNL